MRIACLQFDPQLKQVAANQRLADALVARRLRPGDVDVLLLPEMALSGYCFQSRDEISPYCENPRTGPTASWCAATARALDCVVIAGLPERGDDGQLYNSQVVVDRAGQPIHVYRKHFLYVTDESWAAEGPGFNSRSIPELGSCAFGICMDLNPKKFQAPIDRFEYASQLYDPPLDHHERPAAGRHRLKAHTILLSNNWLRPPADADIDDETYCGYLVNYWAHRLSPVLGQPIVAAIANRVGHERGTYFAGCSCVIDLGARTLLGRLNGCDEGVLLVDDGRGPQR